MSLDLVGIRNVGEFYSQHYLDSLFASDLKDLTSRWAETERAGGPKAPPKRLAVLANAYFRAAAKAAGVADDASRLSVAQDFHASFLEALGYGRAALLEPLDDGRVLPLLLREEHQGKPWLWVAEVAFAQDADDADPFASKPLDAQLPDGTQNVKLATDTWAELLDGVIFRQAKAPRWVMLLAGADAFLIDRAKWAQGKYLHFELGELFGRRDSKAFSALAGLLHRDVVLPAGGTSLLEKLDENSHKHAYAVSTALKGSVQQAIENLANEALYYRRNVSKAEGFDDETLARDLTQDCITYLYRLLFLFYVEARGQELGVAPMGADSYRLGYSLETLRNLEQVQLTSVDAREGFFLHESLERLFHIVQHGYPRARQLTLADGTEKATDTFVVRLLRSQLFDDSRLRILGSVRLRNQAMQKVLELLSLSPEGKGQRGRISYAQLGINQLGAVYEGLLSYRGLFAQEDVIEIVAKGDEEKGDQTYFIPVSRKGEVDESTHVKDARGRVTLHPKGTYLFRMAGRDREKSASYYTPQVLTECLVKYTLKERLGEAGKEGAVSADEILNLTICEPAMGSGAFLNEAVDQLADAYLARKQAEVGRTIEADKYQDEKQKVKAHLAINQCYGVDLNPLAAELGKVSLWLGTLYEGALAPYLDLRIQVGNSLIGARHAVFRAASLKSKATKEAGSNWLSLVPEAVPLGTERPVDGICHFLVPDHGMAPFDDDKVLRELEPGACKTIKAWRKSFTQPFDGVEVERLKRLSERVDILWERHLEKRREVLSKVRRSVQLWGQPAPEGSVLPQDAQTCDEYAKRLSDPDSEGQRLKLVCDYWCALWFWPLSAAEELPSREQWLRDLEAILDAGAQRGNPDVARVARVQLVADRYRFFHWELVFPEVFASDAQGMDIVIGNPPWRRVEWEEGTVLADFDPLLAVKKLSAKQWNDRRATLLGQAATREVFVGEDEEATATQGFLSAVQNYPLLVGQKVDLYKCFMTRSWDIGALRGVAGLFHQPGLFDDPRGGVLRRALSQREPFVARFQNERRLFQDINNQRHYCFSIVSTQAKQGVRLRMMSGLLDPETIDKSFAHDGLGPVPGIKDESDHWDLRGHASRVVDFDEETLALFAGLYDEPNTPALEARLPVVHSREILSVLRKFAKARSRLADLDGQFFCTQHWNETTQQQDGTIRRETRWPNSVGEWVVSGPHFYVGTPFNKTPNATCSHNKDYSVLDLTEVPDDYLPRTNYVPACSPAEYKARTPQWKGRRVTELFRYVNRTMVAPTGERTLTPAIIPPGAAHIDLAFSIAFEDLRTLVATAAMNASVPVDFFVKSTGKGHARFDVVGQLPLPPRGAVRDALSLRALRLNCLTVHYAPLWEALFECTFTADAPTTSDLRAGSYAQLTPKWQRDVALRTPFARRQALAEVDALAALALGMTIDELLLIYRVQFPVMQQYERETFYDQRGKIVFTVSKGLSGVGLDRKQWTEVRDARAGDKLPEWARDAGGAYEPPFDCPDREADMAQAYEVFAKRFGIKVEGASG